MFVRFLSHYIFIISKLWLTSHPREVQWFYWTQETPGTSREIYSEDADDGTRVLGL